MKKTFLVIVGLLAMTAAPVVRAQDTMQYKDMLQNGNYYFNDTINPDMLSFYSGILSMGPMYCGGEHAKYFFSKDSLTIYGIAAGVKVDNPGVPVYDTTDKHSYEYLRLYDPCPDSLICLRQTKVHPNHTPVAYYLDFNRPNTQFNERLVTPIYECYFRPKVVVDSFYVGITVSPWFYVDSTGHLWDYHHRQLGLYKISLPYVGANVERWFTLFLSPTRQWLRKTDRQDYTVIFPILTPNPDTTATGDTLGATEVSLVERLTGVMPNPAAEKARVVSSFGMSMVKVYNASGALVHTQRADGLYVDLDVSRWPAGTYLVRIHTPQGMATKRLVVGR